MNYQAHYDKLIARGKRTLIHGYREKHHIVPRCMGGDNSEDNLVYLTAEEHYVAHQLLVKIYPNEKGLIFAANLLCTDSHGNRVSNKQYGWLKARMSAAKMGMSPGNKGKPSPNKGKPNKKNSERVCTDETRKKRSLGNTGKIRTAEHKETYSAAQKKLYAKPGVKEKRSLIMKEWWAKRKLNIKKDTIS